MCGGKGGGGTSPTFTQPSPITTNQAINQNTNQLQQYSANPLIQSAISQALGQGMNVAGSPFTLQPQQIAPFSPLQQQYFSQLQGLQGMTNPYFAQAQNLMNQGTGYVNQAGTFMNQGADYVGQGVGAAGRGIGAAGQGIGVAGQGIGVAGQQLGGVNQAQGNIGFGQGILAGGIPGVASAGIPTTQSDISNYLNPYGDAALASMKKYVFDPQRTQMMGQQTQMAGGVGADRLALASQNLDKTQADAVSQAMAGYYSNAAQIAQQQKQNALQSGLGLGQLGQGFGNMAMNQGQLGLGAANVGLGMGNVGLGMGNLGLGMGNLGLGIGNLGLGMGGLGSAYGNLGFGLGNMGAAYGNLGSAAQNAALQATGALGQAGTQQQQNQQAQLNALYQNQLMAQAYPFQAAQFAAGISGGLAPALGGTTAGQGTTFGTGFGTQMPSQPAIGSQILGGLTAGAGLLSNLGAFNSNPFGNLFDGLPSNIDAGLVSGNWPVQHGGRIRKQAGGDVDSDDSERDDSDVSVKKLNIPHVELPLGRGGEQTAARMDLTPRAQFPLPWTQQQNQQGSTSNTGKGGFIGSAVGLGLKALPFLAALNRGGAVSPFDAFQPMQEGGETDNPFTVDQPHLSFGDVMSAAKRYYTPKISGALEAGQEDDPARGKLSFLNPFTGPRSAPAAVTPVEPNIFQAPQTAPAMPSARPQAAILTDPSAQLPDIYRASHSELGKAYGPQAASAILGNLGVESPNLDPAETHDQGTGIGIAGWRNERRDALYEFAGKQGLNPIDRQTQIAFLKHEMDTNPQYADMLKRMQNAGSPAEAARIFRTEFERPAGTTQGRPLGLDQAQRLATQFHAGNFDNVGAAGGPRTTEVADRQSVPSYLDRYLPRQREPEGFGQRMANSPWQLAALLGGAEMMQNTGNLGSAIGAGLSTAGKTFMAQRKALDSEELLQQKADMLSERAAQHLREYERKKEYADLRLGQRETDLQIRKQRLEQQSMGRSDPGRARERAIKELSAEYPAGHIPEEKIQELVQKYLLPPSGAATGSTPVNTTKTFKSGTFTKTKDGPDTDPATWSKVGT